MPSVLMDPSTVVPGYALPDSSNGDFFQHKRNEAHEVPARSYEEVQRERLENGSVDHKHTLVPNGTSTLPSTSAQPEEPAVNGIKESIANLNGDSQLEKEKLGLTSVREPQGYYVALHQDEKERPSPNQNEPHKEELVSGRKVGQRWHQSPYVVHAPTDAHL